MELSQPLLSCGTISQGRSFARRRLGIHLLASMERFTSVSSSASLSTVSVRKLAQGHGAVKSYSEELNTDSNHAVYADGWSCSAAARNACDRMKNRQLGSTDFSL